MADGDYGMVENHSRPRVPHDKTYLFFHVRLVAVNFAVAAKRLVVPVRALGQPVVCVVEQLLAFGAELFALSVMTSAVDFNHARHCLSFFFTFRGRYPPCRAM